jgi:hypothetical protein
LSPGAPAKRIELPLEESEFASGRHRDSRKALLGKGAF